MITGTVDVFCREASVRLYLQAPNGILHELEAVADTGFTDDLTLPSGLIIALGLPRPRTDQVQLSNGSLVACAIHEATVLWDGQARAIEVQEGEGTPLLGMGLLLEHLLTLSVTLGGQLTIERL